MRGQLYRGHANATALSSSPVVNALGSESDNGSELLVKSLYHPTSDVSLLQGIMYRLRGPSLMFNTFAPKAIQTAPPLPPNKLFHILSPYPFQPLGSTGKKYVT